MSILYYEKEKTFALQTKNSTYTFFIGEEGVLTHQHWGKKINEISDLPTLQDIVKRSNASKMPADDFQEYRGWGGYSFIEPTLKVRFLDGTRDLFLKYQNHTIENKTNCTLLKIVLMDKKYPITVTVVYTVYEEYDIIERNSIMKNTGTENIMLEKAFSATWFLPFRENYRLSYLTGDWGQEYQPQSEQINKCSKVLETRTGLSGPEASPFFMIDENSEATEKTGEVFFGTLLWSGNWTISINKDKVRRVNITGGINDFDFEWCLIPGEEFTTPIFAGGFTTGGFGEVSRKLHRYQRNAILHPFEKNRIMPVLYNAYGTYYCRINEERIISILDTASDLGMELFVIDAGWYGCGDSESNDFRKGMGDWDVNPDRFPNGLKAISDEVHKKGMLFGLWMEPECVHKDSNLFKEHPDWILAYENREPFLLGNDANASFVLNFALDEVREYFIQKVTEIIEENSVDYFKIDFNRYIPHFGWQQAELCHQKECATRYVFNLYQFYNTIKQRFPNLLIENCAAGGMRMDLGTLSYAGRVNRSDNQDTLDILKLHEGFTKFALPKLAGGGCHISKVFTKLCNGRVSTVKFQAHAAMLGSLAVGIDLNALTESEKTELKGYINLYKEIRHIVHLGELYRLVSPHDKPYLSFQYLSEDKNEAVVFLLGQSMQFSYLPERLRLQGLEKAEKYNVSGFGIFTGEGLMNIGLPILLSGDMDSKLIKIKKCNR